MPESDEVMFIAAAILLSQELRGSSGESMPTQIARAVTNAEKLQEEIRKRRKDLARTQQADAEGLKDHIPDDQFPTPGPLMP